MMKNRLSEETIAMRVAKEIEDGFFINLGIGIPTLVSDFVPEDRMVMFQSENGILGMGGLFPAGEGDFDLANMSGQSVKLVPGASFFDCVYSFDMIRGKHLDAAVLGGFQVSEKGDLSNWMLNERKVGGVGGAMDVAVGAKRLFIAMTHTDKNGNAKIVKECTQPVTAQRCVNTIFTDLAVIEVTEEGLLLKEIAPGWQVEEVQALTEPRLLVSSDLREITL